MSEPHKVKIMLELDVQDITKSASAHEAMVAIRWMIRKHSTFAGVENYCIKRLSPGQPPIVVTKMEVVEPEEPKAEEVDWEAKNLRRIMLSVLSQQPGILENKELVELMQLQSEISAYCCRVNSVNPQIADNVLLSRTKMRFPEVCRKYGIN